MEKEKTFAVVLVININYILDYSSLTWSENEEGDASSFRASCGGCSDQSCTVVFLFWVPSLWSQTCLVSLWVSLTGWAGSMETSYYSTNWLKHMQKNQNKTLLILCSTLKCALYERSFLVFDFYWLWLSVYNTLPPQESCLCLSLPYKFSQHASIKKLLLYFSLS